MTRTQRRKIFDQWFADDCSPKLPKKQTFLRVLAWIAFEAGWLMCEMRNKMIEREG